MTLPVFVEKEIRERGAKEVEEIRRAITQHPQEVLNWLKENIEGWASAFVIKEKESIVVTGSSVQAIFDHLKTAL